jgi:zinc finger SWIM domain-containing protein 3
MNRFDKKRVGAANATNIICPKIMKKLERNKKDADDYICHWSNNLQFEVDHNHEPRRVVDLEAKTCGCDWW